MEYGKALAKLYVSGSAIELSEAEISNKVNEGWALFSCKCESSVNVSVGQIATLEISRVGTSVYERLVGEIINVTRRDDGKSWYYEISAHGPGRELKRKVVYPPSGTMTEQQYIQYIMSYFPNLQSAFYGTFSNTIYAGGRMNYAFDLLYDFCRDHTIDFYCKENTIYFFKGSIGSANVTLSPIISREYVVDSTNIYNKVRLFNPDQIVFDNVDYYTEDITDLDYWNVDSQSVKFRIKSTINLPAGTYAVCVRHLYTTHGWSCTLNLGTTLHTSTITKFNFCFVPICDGPSIFQYTDMALGIYLKNPVDQGCLFYDLGKLSWYYFNKTSYYEVFWSLPFQTVSVSLKDFQNIGGSFSGSISMVEFRITGITHIIESNSKRGAGDIVMTGAAPKPGLIIDKLFFNCLGMVTYTNTESASAYGEREYLPDDPYYVGSYADGTLRAKNIIDRLAKPEISLRKLVIEGTAPINLGYSYIVDNDSFIVREYRQVWDGYDWKTEVGLAKSPFKHPELEQYTRIKYLRKKVRELENIVSEQGIRSGDLASLLGYVVTAPKMMFSDVLSGEILADNLHISATNIDSLVIEKSRIENFSAGTINSIDTIEYIGYISNIDSIGNINYMNVNQIGNIGNIGNITTLQNVSYIQAINNIGNINYFNATQIGSINSIGTIGTVEEMNVNRIGHIGQIQDLDLLRADVVEYIGSISQVDYANIGIANIGQIGSLNNLVTNYLTVNNIATLSTATINTAYITNIGGINQLSVNDMYVSHIGSINSLTANVANISNISGVSNLTVTNANITNLSGVTSMTVSTLNATIIRNVSSLSASTASITNIVGVNQLTATNANISNISGVASFQADTINAIKNLIATNANINTISNVNYFYANNASIGAITSTLQALNAINANISTISSVNKVVALNITVNGTLTVPGAGTIYNLYGTNFDFEWGTLDYFLVGTISGTSISFNIGTINNLMIGSASASVLNFSSGTMGNITVTGGFTGGTFNFTSGYIDSILIEQIATITAMNVNTGLIGSLTVSGIGHIALFDLGSGTIDEFVANIEDVGELNVTVRGSLNSAIISSGSIANCTITAGTIGNLSAAAERVDRLTVTVYGTLNSAYISLATISTCTISIGTVSNLSVTNESVGYLNVTSRGTIVSATITSAQIGGLNVSAGTITNCTIASVGIGTLSLSSGTIGKLELIAPLIGRGVIRAENIVFEPINIVPNPSFEYGGEGTLLPTSTVTSWDSNVTRISGGYNSSYAGVVAANVYAWAYATVPTVPGEVWRGTGWAKSPSSTAPRLLLKVLNSAFQPISTLVVAMGGGVNVWGSMSPYQVTIPTNGAFVVPGLYASGYASTFDGLAIVKDVGTTNLGPGIIETRHIKANAVTTNEIKFSGSAPTTIEGGKLWYESDKKLMKFAFSSTEVAQIPFYPIYFENSPPENLVPNQAFEIDRDQDNIPDFWSITGFGSYSYYLRQNDPVNYPTIKGSKYMEISCPAGLNQIFLTSNFIPIRKDARYYASAYVKGSGHPISYRILWYKENKLPASTDATDVWTFDPPPSSWTKGEGVVYAPSDAAFARVQFLIFNPDYNSNICIDDVVLSEMRAAVSTSKWELTFSTGWQPLTINPNSSNYYILPIPAANWSRLVAYSALAVLQDVEPDTVFPCILQVEATDYYSRQVAGMRIDDWKYKTAKPTAIPLQALGFNGAFHMAKNASGQITLNIISYDSSTVRLWVYIFASMETPHAHY
ncbi:MAG: hypothetical protein QXK24_02985 [Ignisphaera sp.]